MKKGFTLIEMLVVIGIIAVLGGVMLSQFSGSTESAMAAKCLNNMRSLCNAVQADASKESYYPSAGPYTYYDLDTGDTHWQQGWIGTADGNEMVSLYHAPGDKAEQQHYAITNGTVWRSLKGSRTMYVCPSHEKFCRNAKKPIPAWSYVMNSYFGWDRGRVADRYAGKRGFGGGYLTFRYTASPASRKRPIEKVLLFAEVPCMENGSQTPDWSTGAESANDMILQYEPESDESDKYNKSGEGEFEAIGFNHKSGRNYSAHVAFADGHCAKLMLPLGISDAELKKLTTWLCTGQDYTFNGSKYEKAE
jgi:prepilin-type N-terminal cleavage/methylation domain-containing protein/prepilin-type processing-associated H-X9-DG protein